MSEPLPSFAAELSALLRSMPDRTTSTDERADWFDRKAALLDRAADGDPASEAADLARAAREQADRLRGSR